MNNPIALSPEAIREIEKALSHGKGVEIKVRNGKLLIFEENCRKLREEPLI